MVSREAIEKQLDNVGCNFRFWGRSELAELGNILMDTETIANCVNGHYHGGFALLCATDHRVLLIDKKIMSYLSVEDVRFEMISEFGFHNRLLDASVHICTPTKTLLFTSWNQHRLRTLLTYIQKRVIEIRQYYYLAQQFQAMTAQQFQPQPTYMQNLAGQPVVAAAPNPVGVGQSLSSAATTLGAHTYTKLPHFRHRNSRHLGRYATPIEVLPPLPIS